MPLQADFFNELITPLHEQHCPATLEVLILRQLAEQLPVELVPESFKP